MNENMNFSNFSGNQGFSGGFSSNGNASQFNGMPTGMSGFSSNIFSSFSKGKLYVNTDQLKALAESIKTKGNSIKDEYSNNVYSSLQLGNECLEITGIDMTSFFQTLDTIYTNVTDRCNALATYLESNLVSSYDEVEQVINDKFNNEVGEKLAILMGLKLEEVSLGGPRGPGIPPKQDGSIVTIDGNDYTLRKDSKGNFYIEGLEKDAAGYYKVGDQKFKLSEENGNVKFAYGSTKFDSAEGVMAYESRINGEKVNGYSASAAYNGSSLEYKIMNKDGQYIVVNKDQYDNFLKTGVVPNNTKWQTPVVSSNPSSPQYASQKPSSPQYAPQKQVYTLTDSKGNQLTDSSGKVISFSSYEEAQKAALGEKTGTYKINQNGDLVASVKVQGLGANTKATVYDSNGNEVRDIFNAGYTKNATYTTTKYSSNPNSTSPMDSQLKTKTTAKVGESSYSVDTKTTVTGNLGYNGTVSKTNVTIDNTKTNNVSVSGNVDGHNYSASGSSDSSAYWSSVKDSTAATVRSTASSAPASASKTDQGYSTSISGSGGAGANASARSAAATVGATASSAPASASKTDQGYSTSISGSGGAGARTPAQIAASKASSSAASSGSASKTGTISSSGHVTSCFVKGTKVLIENGNKNIENMCVGDKVLSYNQNNNKIELCEVLKSIIHEESNENLYKITVDNDIIEATESHPFYVIGKNWVKAKDLLKGDILMDQNGREKVISSINVSECNQTVYNLEVDKNHNYFVGSGILVHNKQM